MDQNSNQIQDIFDQAADLPTHQREAFVHDICEGDRDLEQKILELLGQLPKLPTVKGEAPSELQMACPYLPGDRLGKYTIKKELGRGGFGVVYLASQENPSRDVAIKLILPKNTTDSSQFIDRFNREQELLVRLDHPCIASFYDSGQDEEGRPYIVMQYIDGHRLDYVCDKARLDIGTRLHIAAEICDAVSHAHSKGVIHRDLKPGNILLAFDEVSEKWRPMVIDFGIAKATENEAASLDTELSVAGNPLGTYGYMSPEQFDGDLDKIGIATDIYAIGVVLYKLLAGRLPVEQSELKRAVYQVKRQLICVDDPPRPGEWLATNSGKRGRNIANERSTDVGNLSQRLSRELEYIPMRALKKEPQERYESAKQMGDDIRRYLKGEKLVAGPDSAVYRLRKTIRCNKGIFAFASAIAMILVAATVISLILMSRAESLAIEAREAQSIAEQSREKALRQAYKGNVLGASIGLEQDEIWLVQRRLEEARLAYGDLPPEEMPFEWQYLNAACDESKLVIPSNGRSIRGMGFNPDGTGLIIRNKEKSGVKLRMWDVEIGEEVEIPDSLHDDYLQVVSDLSVIIDRENSKRIVVDPNLKSPVSELTNGALHQTPFVFSADGSRVAAYRRDGELVTVWDVASGSELSRYGGEDRVRSNRFALSPNGEQLAVIEDGKEVNSYYLQLVDADTGEPITQRDDAGAFFFDSLPTAISFSPDGSMMAVATFGGHGRIVDIGQMSVGEELVPQPTKSIELDDAWIVKLLFNDDGDVLIGASDRNLIRAWDVSTGKVLNTFRGQGENIRHISISPDGEYLATVGRDNVTRLWELNPFVGIDRIISEAGNYLSGMAFSPDSSRVVIGNGWGQLEVRDMKTGELLALLGSADPMQDFEMLRYSPDGVHLAGMTRNGDVQLWNMLTGKLVKTLHGSRYPIMPLLAFNSDGSLLAVNSNHVGSHVRVWDVESGAVKFTSPAIDLCNHIEFSPDSSILYTMGHPADGGIRAWDMLKNEWLSFDRPALDSTDMMPSIFDLSPDGERIAIGYYDGSFDILDSSDLSPLVTVQAHDRPITSIIYSPDGKVVATLCGTYTRGVNFVRLWDPASGEELLSLLCGTDSLRELRFSPDGLMLIAIDSRGRIHSWDTRSRGQQSLDRYLILDKQRELEPLVDSWSDLSDGDVNRVLERFKLDSIDRTELEKAALRNLLLKRLPANDSKNGIADEPLLKLFQWLGGKKL